LNTEKHSHAVIDVAIDPFPFVDSKTNEKLDLNLVKGTTRSVKVQIMCNKLWSESKDKDKTQVMRYSKVGEIYFAKDGDPGYPTPNAKTTTEEMMDFMISKGGVVFYDIPDEKLIRYGPTATWLGYSVRKDFVVAEKAAVKPNWNRCVYVNVLCHHCAVGPMISRKKKLMCLQVHCLKAWDKHQQVGVEKSLKNTYNIRCM